MINKKGKGKLQVGHGTASKSKFEQQRNSSDRQMRRSYERTHGLDYYKSTNIQIANKSLKQINISKSKNELQNQSSQNLGQSQSTQSRKRVKKFRSPIWNLGKTLGRKNRKSKSLTRSQSLQSSTENPTFEISTGFNFSSQGTQNEAAKEPNVQLFKLTYQVNKDKKELGYNESGYSLDIENIPPPPRIRTTVISKSRTTVKGKDAAKSSDPPVNEKVSIEKSEKKVVKKLKPKKYKNIKLEESTASIKTEKTFESFDTFDTQSQKTNFENGDDTMERKLSSGSNLFLSQLRHEEAEKNITAAEVLEDKLHELEAKEKSEVDAVEETESVLSLLEDEKEPNAEKTVDFDNFSIGNQEVVDDNGELDALLDEKRAKDEKKLRELDVFKKADLNLKNKKKHKNKNAANGAFNL